MVRLPVFNAHGIVDALLLKYATIHTTPVAHRLILAFISSLLHM